MPGGEIGYGATVRKGGVTLAGKLCPFRKVEEHEPSPSPCGGLMANTVFQPCLGEKCALAVPVRGGVEFECAFAVIAESAKKIEYKV